MAGIFLSRFSEIGLICLPVSLSSVSRRLRKKKKVLSSLTQIWCQKTSLAIIVQREQKIEAGDFLFFLFFFVPGAHKSAEIRPRRHFFILPCMNVTSSYKTV